MVSKKAFETAYLQKSWTFSVLGVWEAFLRQLWGPQNTPLSVSVLGGLASESAEMPEPEPAEPDFGTGTVRTRSGSGSCRNQIEPNRTVDFLLF